MAKFRAIKNSLLGGQLSPTALGRTDLPQYAGACEKLQNMIPLLAGGAYRRPGTLFDHGFDAAQYTYPRLIPFVVSQAEPYMLALNHDITAPTATAGVMAAYRPTDTFQTSTSGTVTGNHPYRYDSVTNYHELDDVQFAQSVDVMTLVHPNRKPQRVYRTATDTFSIVDFDNGASGAVLRDMWPYRPQNTTATTLQINTATVGTGRTLTASTAIFDPKHVGAMFKVNNAGTYGCAKVTAFTSSTQVTVEVIVAFGGAATPVTTWWESAWSDYRGWPRAVGFYMGRQCYAGNATDRDSIWLSQSANYDVMSVSTITDPLSSPTGSQPFTITMSSQQLNLIQWISPDQTLAVGTLGDEFIIDREDPTKGFGCDNAKVTPQSHFGSGYHMPVRVGSELFFAVSSNDSVRSLVFNLLENAYTSEPVQTLFDDYPKAELVSRRRKYRNFCWDESRKTLWCVDTAGNLFGMTRDKTLQVTTWHSHQMGGFDASLVEDTAATNLYGQLCAGSVVSVAVAPNPTLGMNDVWLTVRRKINGAWVYHVERFMGKHVSSDTVETPFLSNGGNYFADSCVYGANYFATGIGTGETYTFSAAHLEGEELVGTADKIDGRGIFTVSTAAVASGNAVLNTPYPPDYLTIGYNVAVGLPFTSIVAPVRVEAGSQIGTAQGAIKRIHRVTARFYKTLSAKIGRTTDALETLIFRSGDTPMNESPELFTGDHKIDFTGDYDDDGYICIVQDQPLPFAVVSIVAEGMTSDG